MRSDQNIRVANLHDVKILTTLFNSDTNLFGEDNTGYGEVDLAEYISDDRKKMFVFTEGKIVVGALLAEYHTTYVYLDSLIVNESFQQKGIGSALLDEFEKDLERLGIPLIEVLTESDNVIMQSLLKKRGFRPGNTFQFYSKGE
jgi:ribosomal protein S18 acetylase RimI-like enzyme